MHATAIPNNGRWNVVADGLGVALLAALLLGGTQTVLFAGLLLAAPLFMAACMLWGPRG